jgi:hypothetical protein
MTAGSALVLPAVLRGISDPLRNAQSDSADLADPVEAELMANYEQSSGIVEVMLEKLFGDRRNKPTPLPTIEHLDPADLFFVVFTDAHIGPVGVNLHMGYLTIYNSWVEEVVRQTNALRPEFALDLGDSIWAIPGSPQDKWYEPAARHALEIFGKLTCPFHKIAGTHDFGGHHPPTSDPGVLTQIANGSRLYHKFFGRDYYSFESNGCHFIAFNNALANVECPESLEQMQWLKEDLKQAAKSKLSFFLSHEPFFWRSPDEGVARRWNMNTYFEPARAELLEMLSSHGIDCVYSGHTHFEFGNQYKEMYLHTLNSCSNNRHFLFTTGGTPRPFPTEAQVHDPYKFGYLVVRVRGKEIHESWVSTCWRVSDLPPALARMAGARLVCRPATEVEDSVLGFTAPPPTQVDYLAPSTYFGGTSVGPGFEDGFVESVVNDHWWRLGENLGSKWLQVWPIPSDDQDWSNVQRGLTLGRPRGVKIAVPVPSAAIAMGETWTKLQAISEEIAAVVVCNGTPTIWFSVENPNLVNWMPLGTKEDWAKACGEARRLVSRSTKVVLARLPLRELGKKSPLTEVSDDYEPIDLSSFGSPGSGLAHFKEVVGALEGKADIIAVWVKMHGAPEDYANEIATMAQVGRSHGLDLWLDAVGWDYVDEPLRSAYLLRLMALCQCNQVKLFWWSGPADEAGLLDGFYDPTPMYYAAQAWQAFVDAPIEPLKIEVAKTVKLRWNDRRGRNYVAWWRPSNTPSVETTTEELGLPKNALVADPLHGRLLQLDSGDHVPICGWPLVARWG